MIYRLVTWNEPVQLTLTTAEAQEKRAAIKELKKWADENNHRVARKPTDTEATCIIQELEPV